MRASIKYKELNSILFESFPDFEKSVSDSKNLLKENASALFVYFVSWISKNFGDEEMKEKVIVLMDRMNESKDKDVEFILNDLMLDFYSQMKEAGIKTDRFIMQLSPQTRQRYFENIDLWEKGNSINEEN